MPILPLVLGFPGFVHQVTISQSPVERRRLARKIAALPKLTDDYRGILYQLCQDAVLVALTAVRTQDADRRDLFTSIITRHATPADTKEVFKAMRWTEAHPVRRHPFEGRVGSLREWLNHHGDADFLRSVQFEYPPFSPITRESPHRTLPSSQIARIALARKLCQATHPNIEQMSTLEALGRDALKAEFEAVRQPNSPNRNDMAAFIAKAATPQDTADIEELSSGLRNDSGAVSAQKTLDDWLNTKGDADYVLSKRYPSLVTDGEEAWWDHLPLISRSRDPRVVDRFFSLLKDPNTPAPRRQEIYGFIAASERPEILRWILDHRESQRRRTTPHRRFSTKNDFDHDGIPDAWDRNPMAAERHLSEEERAMQTAFEAQFKFVPFDDRPLLEPLGQDMVVSIEFPFGCKPFELFGVDHTIERTSRFSMSHSPKPHVPLTPVGLISISLDEPVPHPPLSRGPFFGFEPKPMVPLPPNATTATVILSFSGEQPSREFNLRKINGTWFVVRSATRERKSFEFLN